MIACCSNYLAVGELKEQKGKRTRTSSAVDSFSQIMNERR